MLSKLKGAAFWHYCTARSSTGTYVPVEYRPYDHIVTDLSIHASASQEMRPAEIH